MNYDQAIAFSDVCNCLVDTLARTWDRVARLALLGPNFKNLVLNNTSWPQNFRLTLWLFFRIDLVPCKNLGLTTLVQSEKPYFFTFLTN